MVHSVLQFLPLVYGTHCRAGLTFGLWYTVSCSSYFWSIVHIVVQFLSLVYCTYCGVVLIFGLWYTLWCSSYLWSMVHIVVQFLCEQVLFVRFYNNPAPVIRSMHYCTVRNPGTGADDTFVLKRGV